MNHDLSSKLDVLSRVRWDKEAELSRFPELSFGVCGVGDQADLANWHRLEQVHGSRIVAANAATLGKQEVQADGIYSQKRGEILSVQTADCLPVILWAQNEPFLALLHAGWRSLAAGIVGGGVLLAQDCKVQANELKAFLGPCISQNRFEVGPEVVEKFSDLGLSEWQLGLAVSKGQRDRWHIDLAMVAVQVLLNLGVVPENINVWRSCTYDSPKRWHSFRREGSAHGLNYTWAVL